jgi:hypothetical protein
MNGAKRLNGSNALDIEYRLNHWNISNGLVPTYLTLNY